MCKYADKLKTYLDQNPINYTDGDSLLEQLFWCYTEANACDDPEIKEQYRQLYRSVPELPSERFDKVFDLICGLSAQQERLAFQTGAKIGFRLAAELLI